MVIEWAYGNLWSTIKIDNNVSVFDPGGEMGRLVSMHEAPATPNVNPFLPVAKRRDGGVPQQHGGGRRRVLPSNSFVNSWVERTRAGDPNMECSPRIPWVEDSNGGAQCSPGNSLVNSWVERMRGADPNMRCSPGNSCRNAWVDSTLAEEDSLATRLCYDFTLLYIEACTYTR